MIQAVAESFFIRFGELRSFPAELQEGFSRGSQYMPIAIVRLLRGVVSFGNRARIFPSSEDFFRREVGTVCLLRLGLCGRPRGECCGHYAPVCASKIDARGCGIVRVFVSWGTWVDVVAVVFAWFTSPSLRPLCVSSDLLSRRQHRIPQE